jgi:hypothetical protein
LTITVWRDGRRLTELPAVIDTIIHHLILHRDEIAKVPRGSVIADFSEGHVDVSVQPAKMRLGGGSTK